MTLLTNEIMSAQKSLETNDEDVKSSNYRHLFYKKPIKKDNFRLDIEDEDCPQEARRKQLLLIQKKNREAAFNAGRAILEAVINADDNLDDNRDAKFYGGRQRFRQYANKLMLSEWMLEVPEDYMEKWVMVPCPEGRRTLLVACKGKTKAYSRRGDRMGKFKSALPGGNPYEHNNSCTILDCIWMKKEKQYYVLDVLAWSNQPLLNCDAEFRLFWLKSKFSDLADLQTRNTVSNTFPIFLLPSVSCNEDTSEIMEKSVSLGPLDGFLFFHRDGQYTNGRTPLVTWLKPFMLPEVLGIEIHPLLDDKPDGYIDYRHYIDSQKSKRNVKQKAELEMDTEELET